MKKVFALFIALLMLCTNAGFTFSTHYCGGKAVKSALSFGNEELSCGMMEMDQPCVKGTTPSGIHAKPCCSNKHLSLSIEDDFNNPAIISISTYSVDVVQSVFTYSNLYSFDTSTPVKYLNYSPPFLDPDIPVLVQSFLL